MGRMSFDKWNGLTGMGNVISIGNQGFDSIRENNYFFIDKSSLIKEWWDSGDVVTLIIRPRRFGKTLNMSMLNCFFSSKYAGRSDLFKGLSIWDDSSYRDIQGTYPVIYLSCADVKQTSYAEAVSKIKSIILEMYSQYERMIDKDALTDSQRQLLSTIKVGMDDIAAQNSLKILSSVLAETTGKKVIILLDEYDTPMQEAYLDGYWDEFTAFIRGFFNAAFKTNTYLERAMLTGVTRVSKESAFSDLNNLVVVTTTSDRYSTCFGFTKQEVYAALDSFNLGEQKDNVKKWYDGFTFGRHKDIYNPWSITNYLKEQKFIPYWALTSSNSMISRLIQSASIDMKMDMETLLNGGEITVCFDEQIVFSQLENDENAVWSLMVASGYLKVCEVEYRGMMGKPWYHLAVTNMETLSMFTGMFTGWFADKSTNYNSFVKAFISGNVKEMNIYMKDVALSTISNFDSGMHPSSVSEPERFYHGLVLGLLSELYDTYEVKSNRESGYGRYDVMVIPKIDKQKDAMILEFKVCDIDTEGTLEDTAEAALQQIKERQYDAELIARGIDRKHIRHYGFAFQGKKVLIKEQ